MKSLKYQTHVLQRCRRCIISIPLQAFGTCWINARCHFSFGYFPGSFIFNKCMRVLGLHTLSVRSPGPPPAPCQQETGAWMRVFVSPCWAPRLVGWLSYSSQRLTRCRDNLRFSSFPRMAACHQLPRGNPGHGKRAGGSSRLQLQTLGSLRLIFHQKWQDK